jgi:hypothetical protein
MAGILFNPMEIIRLHRKEGEQISAHLRDGSCILGGVAWLVHVYTIRRQYYSKQVKCGLDVSLF